MKSFEIVHLNNVSNMIKKAIDLKSKTKGHFNYEQGDDFVEVNWYEKNMSIIVKLCPAFNGNRCELEVVMEDEESDRGCCRDAFVPVLWNYSQLSKLVDKLIKDVKKEMKK
jgi:hypothetical protein